VATIEGPVARDDKEPGRAFERAARRIDEANIPSARPQYL